MIKKLLDVFGLRKKEHLRIMHHLCPKEVVKIAKFLHRELSREKMNEVMEKAGELLVKIISSTYKEV